MWFRVIERLLGNPEVSPWFRVIERLLGNPEVSPTELSQQIGVRRLATVRRMMRKTREALEGEAGAGGDPFDVAVREPVTCGAALSQIWKPKSTDGPRPLGGALRTTITSPSQAREELVFRRV